jgi:hypothetical protein
VDHTAECRVEDLHCRLDDAECCRDSHVATQGTHKRQARVVVEPQEVQAGLVECIETCGERWATELELFERWEVLYSL